MITIELKSVLWLRCQNTNIRVILKWSTPSYDKVMWVYWGFALLCWLPKLNVLFGLGWCLLDVPIYWLNRGASWLIPPSDCWRLASKFVGLAREVKQPLVNGLSHPSPLISYLVQMRQALLDFSFPELVVFWIYIPWYWSLPNFWIIVPSFHSSCFFM